MQRLTHFAAEGNAGDERSGHWYGPCGGHLSAIRPAVSHVCRAVEHVYDATVMSDAASLDGSELLRGMQAVTDTALAHLDVEDLVEALLDRIQRHLRVDTATVLLLDPYGQELIATASRGLSEEVWQGVRLPVGRGFAGRVAAAVSLRPASNSCRNRRMERASAVAARCPEMRS